MATNAQASDSAAPAASLSPAPSRFALLFLVPFILLIHGYHPFAGDAGLYVAAIRHTLSPSLYPVNAAFVTTFARHSVFAWTLTTLVSITRLPLTGALLVTHLASLWLYLCGVSAIASRVFESQSARWCAVLLAAVCCALPVAGTALVLMDPYVTARSFSTPLSLFAVAACLDRAWPRTILLLVCAVLFHPLMGACAAAFVIVLALIREGRSRDAALTGGGTLVAAALICAVLRDVPVSPAYRQAILLPERTFLFLARWHWYEILGLVLPLVLLAVAARRLAPAHPARALCLAGLCIGIPCIFIAAALVQPAGPYVLVPIQILRSFHIIYLVGIVLFGGILGSITKRNGAEGVALFLVAAAGAMSLVESVTWPDCTRIELPGRGPTNPYEQAFLWIREHTPRDAVFAFNPRLVYLPGEDEQGFRAITERDHLADDKDAGVVALLPDRADRWATQRNSQLFVDSMTDAERITALAPLGANWLLLAPTAHTGFPCPFRNRAIQVCQLVPPLPPAPAPHLKANGPGLLT
jgi:hypothetical protein